MHAQSRPREGCRGGRDQDKMRTNKTERGAGRGVWHIFRFIFRIGSVFRSLLVVLPFAPHPSETGHSVNHPTRKVIYSKHPARQLVYKDHRHFEDQATPVQRKEEHQATPVQRKEEHQATPALSAEDQATLRALSARASIPRGSAKQQRPGRSRPARPAQPGERGPGIIMAPRGIGTVEWLQGRAHLVLFRPAEVLEGVLPNVLPRPYPSPAARAPNGSRRVQLVRRDGQDVSTLYGRGGAGGQARPYPSPAARARPAAAGAGVRRLGGLGVRRGAPVRGGRCLGAMNRVVSRQHLTTSC
jgi:hypothetical protein